MRDIFTYPDNSPFYIDPRYLGDDTVGFQKRIKDLMEGNIYHRGAVNPPQSVNDTMTFLGKYYNYYNTVGDINISLWDFNKYSVMEVVTKEKPNTNATSVETIAGGESRVYFAGGHGLDPNTTIQVEAKIQAVAGLGPNDNQFYDGDFTLDASKIPDANHIDLPTQNHGSNWRAHRHGNGVLWRSDANAGAYVDGGAIGHRGYTDATNDTGTSAQTYDQARFWYTKLSDYTFQMYTDQAKTTEATLNEHYYMERTVASADLPDVGSDKALVVDVSGWTAQERADLAAEQNGWCRVYYSNLSGGTFTTTGGDRPIGTTLNYSQDYYWVYDGGNQWLNIYDERGAGQDFVNFNIDAGETVDINIKIIDPARFINGTRPLYVFESTDPLQDTFVFDRTNWWNYALNKKYHIVDEAETQVFFYGGHIHQYLDSNGDTQNGAQTDNMVWVAGMTSAIDSSTNSMFVDHPDHTLGFDTAGRLNSWTVTGGKLGVQGTLAKYMQPLIDRADEYTPPAPTNLELAAAEDSFDLNAEWDNYSGYTSVHKTWPHAPIRSAVINQKTPVINTYSQSGQKYTRSAGFTRWTLDVKYAPLTGEQFRELMTYAQLARGGAVNFFFELDAGQYSGSNSQKLLGFERYNPGSSTVFPKVMNFGNQIVTLAGYASNEAGVIKEGMLLKSGGGSRNGDVEIALNNADANVFGEVKVKLGFRDYGYGDPQPGYVAQMNPQHFVVSLMEDDFQYTYRGDGLYDVSVKFELGMWT